VRVGVAFGRLLAGACTLRRIALAGLLAVASAGPAAADRLALIEQRGRLIVGVKTDYPPWGTVAPDGTIVGLEPDLARDLAGRLGLPLELVPVTSANRLPRVVQGSVDVVIATLGDTMERRDLADLIQPHYYASGVNLLARADAPYRDWSELRGRPVCLTEGAYFNRTLAERYLVDPVIFPGTRDTMMALRDGRCAGWAYDDTVLGQILAEAGWADHALALPTVLRTPWALAVAPGEGHGRLGVFLADAVAEWHRSGRLVALQAEWGLPPNPFLEEQRARWSAEADGAPACTRGPDGRFPAACLSDEVARTAGAHIVLPLWAEALQGRGGLDLRALFDPFNRARLLRGLGLTVALSLGAIAGSIAIGILLALAHRSGGRVVRLPVRAVTGLARMTPPILQLYVVFFGIGGLVASGWGITVGGFAVAALVLSLYAGATNAALLSSALDRLAAERPDQRSRVLLPAAIDRAWEGLVSTCVNIVKAAGLASTIAVAELVSAVNATIAEGGHAGTLMNLLLVFHFLFVLGVIALLRAARALVVR
jgi:polar amino acid transport system substrate-binding protein